MQNVIAALLDQAEEEKAALARALHGELGGALAAARLSLSALRDGAAPAAPLLSRLESQLSAALAVKQRLIDVLRPGLLDHFGAGIALSSHAETACRDAGVAFEASVATDLPRLPPALAILLFRVGVSALQTMLAARPATVRLTLAVLDFQVRCLIDAERVAPSALDAPRLAGYGEWLSAHGGSWRVDQHDGGSRFVMSVPLPRVSGSA